jgi:hypothetical protein
MGVPPAEGWGRLRAALGEPDARAGVTFVGATRIEVLRFRDPADGGLVRYATLGADPEAELLLTLRAGRADTDGVLRALAVVAASPQVEGVTLAPGAALDLGEPLWPGAPFSAVLVDRPADAGTPRLLPLLPMTRAEAAWRRARGTDALRDLWRLHGTDLLDPTRGSVRLTPLGG